ncbi:MAG: putative Ig domain-containing protein [Candidatus Pacearchaeota archaeon]
MKKLFLLLLLSVLILPLAASEDIAYIVKNANSVDSGITASINELGYTYKVIQESQILSTNFSNYKMMIVGDDIFSNPQKIPVSEYNSLVVNSKYMVDWGWSSRTGSYSSPTSLSNNVNFPTSITNGVKSPYFAYTLSDPSVSTYALLGKKPTGIKIISYRTLQSNTVIALVLPGTKFLNGKTAKEKSIYFGITKSQYWTSDSKKMFKNSVKYLIEGEDKDKDGYYDNDCNDSNPQINPGAVETPYDGIDQDCTGNDLIDVDNDGYCKLNFGIANKTAQCQLETGNTGSDCNDSDATYNPAAQDLSKNCKNDPPQLIQNIPTIFWNEGEKFELKFLDYINDPENDTLVYGIKSISTNENIIVNITGNKAIFSSKQQWFGTGWIIFNISDGKVSIETNQIILNISGINDPPILEKINDIYVFEGQLVKIIPNATDPEGDNITFTYSSPLNALGEWGTSIGDEGVYNVNVSATDRRGGIDIESFKIIVMPKIVINEFSSNTINESDWIEVYNTGSTQANLSLCVLKDLADNELKLTGILPGKDFNVFEWSNRLDNAGDRIILKCNSYELDRVVYGGLPENAPVPSDGQSTGRKTDGFDTDNDGNDFKIYNKPSKKFSNSADTEPPIVSLLQPNNNVTFETRDVNFTYNVSDNSHSLSCSIYTNIFGAFKSLQTSSVPLLNGSSTGNFLIRGINDGKYLWNIACKDSRNIVFAPENRTIIVSAPDAPVITPIGSKFVQENKTLEFNVEATDQENNIISITAKNLPLGATFSNKLFKWTPDFNQSGTYNVIFKVTDTTNLTDEESVTISVGKTILPPEFKDAKQCNNINESLEISIKDPRNNKKFSLNDSIKVEVRLKNNLDEEKKFDVETHLYDLTEDESLDDNDDSVRIGKGKTENIELELKIPDDADDSNKFAVYVIAESDNKECNIAFTNIKIEREDDAMKISKFNINPATTSRNQEVFFEITVQNIGADDQDDVVINVYNKDLKLNIKSDGFEVERFNEDDKKTKSFSFMIPENVKLGVYNISVDVLFNNNKISSESSLTIINEIPAPARENNVELTKTQTPEIIKINQPTTPTTKENKESELKSNPKNYKSEKTKVSEVKSEIKEEPSILSQLSISPSYLEDPNVRLAIWVLDLVLAIGIIAFIIKLILIIRG